MKKDEAEKAIRSLATTWFDTLPEEKREHPSFYAFKDWLSANHYSHYLDFRSRMGANYENPSCHADGVKYAFHLLLLDF